MNERKDILNGIQNQIISFDNKAGLMLSIVGIVFALALSFLDVFHSAFYKETSKAFQMWYSILFVSLLVLTMWTILCFIFVIFPRKNKTGTRYPNYYLDICKLDDKELESSLSEYTKEDKMIIGQIKINADICKRKHQWFIRGAVSLMPFAFLIALLSCLIAFA